mmetsp:Transcript_16399/g.16391  ORF Transcript_16399/g.16391 Transcript_16399/m.16391 type:complete len:95 (-) Transcript_16399:302-586(-)
MVFVLSEFTPGKWVVSYSYEDFETSRTRWTDKSFDTKDEAIVFRLKFDADNDFTIRYPNYELRLCDNDKGYEVIYENKVVTIDYLSDAIINTVS